MTSNNEQAAPEDPEEGLATGQDLSPEEAAERRRRRAVFLKELAEARELRERVTPRRSKAARLRQAMRMRSFRT
ncbi:hypothetical protein TH66_21550 [Carbonactinospora thermoautotrophica]|uniref:Uncharacterized protein n=1 Tax=Carbonactinospora thermoautotrophica TaxID=1469144 RepID=A0A132N9Z5_9ACTN|nr:hypothetical protein [Carbonactinospora thermoautotrophica]KWW97951.1 hypothetical protein TH66_21550 [Carbonactinospora thermoautotrophica]KWX03156.1 hypothetical protein LI90_4207 [Carbonactinospora thermoautotrophica]KWX06995.1 hypothetical protein TR74_20245 [Carbonactinospora thermoautotrophica]